MALIIGELEGNRCLQMPPPPEATKKACEALQQVIDELDSFEDRSDLASQETRGTFEEWYEMFVELAVAKGFLPRGKLAREPESSSGTEGDENQEEKDGQGEGEAEEEVRGHR